MPVLGTQAYNFSFLFESSQQVIGCLTFQYPCINVTVFHLANCQGLSIAFLSSGGHNNSQNGWSEERLWHKSQRICRNAGHQSWTNKGVVLLYLTLHLLFCLKWNPLFVIPILGVEKKMYVFFIQSYRKVRAVLLFYQLSSISLGIKIISFYILHCLNVTLLSSWGNLNASF